MAPGSRRPTLEELLLALLDNVDASLSLVVVDRARQVVACNRAFSEATERLAGIRAAPGVRFEALVRPEKKEIFDQMLRRVEAGQSSHELLSFETPEGPVYRDVSLRPLFWEGAVDGFTFEGRDVTARIRAEDRLREANRRLVNLSHQAGMSLVATGILHDAGNVLNSINVAASQIHAGLRRLPIDGIARAARRLEESDAQKVGAFLGHLHRTQRDLVGDLGGRARDLLEHIEHLRAVISAQQRQAGALGIVEPTSLEELGDLALALHAERIRALRIQVQRDYGEAGILDLDRHRVVSILQNLVSNACDALAEVRGPRTLRVRTRLAGEAARVEVEDDGSGIASEDLARLFEHGFTTKPDGHGFGLHASANAARELGGGVTGRSAGPGRGACFVLSLPRKGQPSP